MNSLASTASVAQLEFQAIEQLWPRGNRDHIRRTRARDVGVPARNIARGLESAAPTGPYDLVLSGADLLHLKLHQRRSEADAIARPGQVDAADFQPCQRAAPHTQVVKISLRNYWVSARRILPDRGRVGRID